MFARKLYAQVYLHKGLIIYWSILEKEFDERYFKRLAAQSLPNKDLCLVTKCFDPIDFPDIKEEDFVEIITSDLAPNWINQWKYNTDYCLIKAKSNRDKDLSSHMDVLGYIRHLQEQRRN